MNIFDRFIKNRKGEKNSIINLLKISIVFFILLATAVIIIVPRIIKKSYDTEETHVYIDMLDMDTNFVDIIRITAEKNADWSNLPLSKKFRKKYNQKYGILGKNDNYTDLYTISEYSNKNKNIVVLEVLHDYKKEEYYIHYIVNSNNELDDIEIIDKKLLYDENGNEIVYKSTMNERYLGNIIDLAAPGRLDWNPFDYIYVTNNYVKKWAVGFIDYNISCGIDSIDAICSKDKQIVYLDVVQDKFDEEGNIIGDEWEKYFKIHYFTDENGWLDDVEVEEISKEEIDKLLNEKNSY